MRAMADDREITATLGVPVQPGRGGGVVRLGVLPGVAGLLLADLGTLDADA